MHNINNDVYFCNKEIKSYGKITILSHDFEEKTFELDRISNPISCGEIFIHSKNNELEKYLEKEIPLDDNCLLLVDDTANVEATLCDKKKLPGVALALKAINTNISPYPLRFSYNVIYFEQHFEADISLGFQKTHLEKRIQKLKEIKETKVSKKF